MTAYTYNETSRSGGTFDRADAFDLERRARAAQAFYLGKALAAGGDAVTRGVKAVGTRLRTYWARRQALAHLNQLDDRLLADIGLSRGNLLGQILQAEANQTAAAGVAKQVVTSAANLGPAANTNSTARAA